MISGSIIGTILGLNQYETPEALFERMIAGEEVEPNEAMERGKICERALIEYTKKWTNIEFERNENMFVDKEYEFFVGRPDALSGDTVLEIKTSSHVRLEMTYYAQVQWYMMLTGLRKAMVAVFKIPSIPPFQMGLILQKFPIDLFILDKELYVIDYDESFVREAREKGKKFWEHLQSKIVPEGMEISPSVLYKAATNGKYIEADNDLKSLIETYLMMHQNLKTQEQELERLKKRIQERMQDSEYIVDSGQVIVHWKNQKREIIDGKVLKEKYPSVYEDVKKEQITRVFRVVGWKNGGGE